MKKVFFFIVLVIFWSQIDSQSAIDSTIRNLVQINETSKSQIQQLSKEVSDLKLQIQRQQKAEFGKFLSVSLFLDAAISSSNNLQGLVLKESYRNKIASLNNPTSNELGFSLETEIHNALKPLLQKARKTNNNKFSQVVGSFLETGKRSPGSLFPAGNIFTSIIGMVGNLTVKEKAIDQQDLDSFIRSIEKYFNQYERLYQSNLAFNSEMEKMKGKLRLLQDDIRLVLQDIVMLIDKSIKRNQLKSLMPEEVMLRYFENKKLSELLNKLPAGAEIRFPQDAIKSCKEIASGIQRVYDEYVILYVNNYKEIRAIISDTKGVSGTINHIQLGKTLKDLEALYTESRGADSYNLRLKTLFERLEAVTQ
ncbi:MAG: hypothetical protein JNN00_15580 [Chitinophagaceae bacterium]|nr:hypothetical protein [Chitinophagaceae bacterium]